MLSTVIVSSGVVLVFGSAVLTFVEAVLYLLYATWYYRLGPALHREQWQTGASRESVLAALTAVLPGVRPPGVRRGAELLLRHPWYALSAWPRFRVTVEQHDHGAVINFEARPFICMAPFAAGFLLLALGRVEVFFSLVMVAFCVITYAACWSWEIRKTRRMADLRRALVDAGLRVCEACGYDLFGHDPQRPCPECGKATAEPVPRALAAAEGVAAGTRARRI